jgi:hypothetical protein
MFATIRRLLALPAEMDRLRAEVAAHAERNLNATHTTPFWRGYNERQEARLDRCPECGYAWARGGPELHFNDPKAGERCPRAAASDPATTPSSSDERK